MRMCLFENKAEKHKYNNEKNENVLKSNCEKDHESVHLDKNDQIGFIYLIR